MSSSDIDEKGSGNGQSSTHAFKQNNVEGGSDSTVTLTEAEDAQVTRKIDARLLIILGMLYAISLIDRANISVARIAGMNRDLKLTGERYGVATLVFFVPYILFELPSNILLAKVGARNHLTGIVLAWGIVMIGMGFIKTYEQLVVTRVLLGLLEAGFFPGCVFLISCWYTRFQTQKRLAVFYLTSMVISGFANIVGYCITLLGGKHGVAAWRWVFIVFGAATVGLGLIAFFILVDFPQKNTFLKPEETAHILRKIELERGDSVPDRLTVRKALKHLSDPTIWAYGVMFACSTTPSYAFSFFLPVILGQDFPKPRDSLLLAAPPYIWAAIWTFIIAYGSDKLRIRSAFIGLNALVCMTGLLIMAFTKPIGSRYFGTFLALGACQANVPAILAYQANNILSHSKRAVSSAVVIGFGGIGGIVASLAFREKDTPKYIPGLGTAIGCQGLIIIILIGLTLRFKSANKAVDEGRKEIEGRPGFKYTL